MTYGEIYHEFLESTSIPKEDVADYRPCVSDYDVPYVPYAIIVWLKNGSRLIYISKTTR